MISKWLKSLKNWFRLKTHNPLKPFFRAGDIAVDPVSRKEGIEILSIEELPVISGPVVPHYVYIDLWNGSLQALPVIYVDRFYRLG